MQATSSTPSTVAVRKIGCVSGSAPRAAEQGDQRRPERPGPATRRTCSSRTRCRTGPGRPCWRRRPAGRRPTAGGRCRARRCRAPARPRRPARARRCRPDSVISTAPTSITRRSPKRSVACPEGTASSSGTTAKEAVSAPSQAVGTSSSIARYADVGRRTKVMTWVSVECRAAGRAAVVRRSPVSSGSASRSADRAPRLVSTCRRISSAAVSAVAVPDRLEQLPVLGGPGVELLVAAAGLEAVPAVAVGLHPEAVEGRPAARCATRDGWRRGTGGGSPAGRATGGCSAPRARRARREASARSASVRRCAASDAASGSRLRRSSSRSRASVASSGRTRASWWASSSTRPSCLSRRRASRRGVVLMPISARARPAGGRRRGRARRRG